MPTYKRWCKDSACGESGGTYLKISAQGQDGVAPGARLVTFSLTNLVNFSPWSGAFPSIRLLSH